MSELPISCFRCRRRKIKCNKRKPCNQCTKQKIPCQFPSKFRNVSYDGNAPENSESSPSDSAKSDAKSDQKSENSASPSEVSRLEEQVRRLELENQYIREKYRHKIQKKDEGSDSDHSAGPFDIRGETTENGEKYYGPLSSNNMAEDFDKISKHAAKMAPDSALKHHSWTADPFNIAESDDEPNNEPSLERFSEKQPLPWVVGKSDPVERNLAALVALVRNFFETKTYDYFISEGKVVRFIEEYASTPDYSWEGSDDLLLLHMILILSVQRLSPTKHNEIRGPAVTDFQHLWKATRPLKQRLFRGFSKLRHNLVNESYVTVQAYILCTEWEFIEQRYEESWSMMFHCCSIAYALGLHVVSKSSSLFDSCQDGNEEKTRDGYDEYFSDELPKLRVWFALRNLNSQMCSILGRPNPIMIQVNNVSLPLTSVSNVEDAEALNDLTNSQLKSGSSECIRLSNSNMIESFLKKVSMENVLAINTQFSTEINKLSYYLSPQYENSIDGVVKKINTLTDMPTTVTRKDILVDLIVLHVNRVKLLEPFVDMSPPNKEALNYVMGSILLFYEHTCELVSEFVKNEIPRILESNEATQGQIRLDKVFIFRDPFFASFIYQGIVVTFILISLKANDFIQENNGDFISQVESQLHMLLGLHTSISKLVKDNIHLWSKSNIFLMQKILNHIAIMKQAFKDYKSSGQTISTFGGFEYDPQVAEMLGSNLRDPFWMANPENSANFLGISDDSDDVSMRFNEDTNNNGTNIMLSNPSISKLRINYPSHQNQEMGPKMDEAPPQNNAMLFAGDQMMDGQAEYMDQDYTIDMDQAHMR